MFGATLSDQDTYSGASVRVPAALLIVSFALACGHPSATHVASPVSGVAADWPYLGKSRVTASRQAMVVSGSPIASEVGRNILQQGGSAVDAAVAVGFALAVVHPEAGNIGGGGFMIIRPRNGKVQALAVTSLRRSSAAPEIPTIAESGYPGFETAAWYGVLVPIGTPRDIVMRLNRATIAALGAAEVKERLVQEGSEPMGSSPAQFGAYIKSEIEKWSKVVREANIKGD